jgi:hypothetical protein
VPGGAALIHSDRKIALLGDGIRYFRTQQQAARTRFGALPDGEFDGVSPPHIVNVDSG